MSESNIPYLNIFLLLSALGRASYNVLRPSNDSEQYQDDSNDQQYMD